MRDPFSYGVIEIKCTWITENVSVVVNRYCTIIDIFLSSMVFALYNFYSYMLKRQRMI